MSLREKKSLYDRHSNGTLGNTVEGPNGTGPNPSDGGYFRNDGQSQSPFLTKDGGDYLKALLTKKVQTGNIENMTYLPSPTVSDFQDLDGATGGQGYFHGVANPGRFQGKQLGGQDLHRELLTKSYTYQHGISNPVTVGPSPGPSGNSDFQDINGAVGQASDFFDEGVLSGRKGQYKNGGPADGRY